MKKKNLNVAPGVLLKGAWYSLEQCGSLLRDAETLYRSNAYPSAVALAMFGREELGMYRMLLDWWRKSATGSLPTIAMIQAAFDDHVKKQQQGQMSVSFITEPSSPFDAAVRAQMKHSPQDREYQEAEKVIQGTIKGLVRRTPNDRHELRMKALFVDLQDSGAEWDRPSAQISQAEAKKYLGDAAKDYAVQRNNVSDLDLLRGIGEETLAVALGDWLDRPDLPLPVRPDYR